jgi:cell division protein FtsN
MKGKGSETSSSSLVIISRRVLVTVIAGISLFSFGLGYFFGYGGTSATKMVKHVEADSKIVASDERTVLDSTGKPTMVAPTVIPGVVPKEPPLKQRIEEGTKTLPPASGEMEKQKKPVDAPVPGNDSKSVLKKDTGESEKKIEKDTEKKPENKPQGGINDKPRKERVLSVAKAKKPALKKPSVKTVKENTRKSYLLQVGAFQDPRKAERLRKDLSAKGYTVSVTIFSPKAGKTFSRVRLGPYATKKEAEEIHATLKGQGIEGVVFPGTK